MRTTSHRPGEAGNPVLLNNTLPVGLNVNVILQRKLLYIPGRISVESSVTSDRIPQLSRNLAGIVGEILVKFLPDANNHLVELLNV